MFKSLLRDIVTKTEGGIAGVLMGFDGIAVDSFMKDDNSLNIEDIGMEYSVVLGQIKQAAEMLEIGAAREVTVQAERMTAVIRMLNEDYFVAVVVTPEGNSGKARFLMRIQAEKLLENLA